MKTWLAFLLIWLNTAASALNFHAGDFGVSAFNAFAAILVTFCWGLTHA